MSASSVGLEVEVEAEVVYDEVVSVEVYHVWLPGHRPTVPR